MAQPQEPIIVFEPNDGLCAYRTPEAAVGHDYGEPRPPPEWFDQLEFFDARGRRLRRVAGSSSGLEVDSEQDDSAHIRERVRGSLAESQRWLREKERTADESDKRNISKTLSEISAFLEDEPDLDFDQVAEALSMRLHETHAQHRPLTSGDWWHYGSADHHK